MQALRTFIVIPSGHPPNKKRYCGYKEQEHLGQAAATIGSKAKNTLDKIHCWSPWQVDQGLYKPQNQYIPVVRLMRSR